MGSGALRVREPHSGLARIPFVEHCRLDGPEGTRDGLLCNLSALGAYVTAEPLPETAEWFVLSFALPEQGELISVDAVVAWRNTRENRRIGDLPPGCGLRFLTLGAKDRLWIQRIVKAFLGAQKKAS